MNLSETITEKDINRAFKEFDNGKRPTGCNNPRSWYVLSKNGDPYPAKMIWALAIGEAARKFKTNVAKKELEKRGFEIVKISNCNNFDKSIQKSLESSRKARLKRLKKANRKPKRIIFQSVGFARNPDVVAETLFIANGICQKCEKPAPFRSKKTRKPYLEVHHITPLAKGGDDTIKNAIALCPNCHRKEHFG